MNATKQKEVVLNDEMVKAYLAQKAPEARKAFIKTERQKALENTVFTQTKEGVTTLIKGENLSETKRYCLNSADFREVLKKLNIETLSSKCFHSLIKDAFTAFNKTL